jgi:hypothetical protein
MFDHVGRFRQKLETALFAREGRDQRKGGAADEDSAGDFPLDGRKKIEIA